MKNIAGSYYSTNKSVSNNNNEEGNIISYTNNNKPNNGNIRYDNMLNNLSQNVPPNVTPNKSPNNVLNNASVNLPNNAPANLSPSEPINLTPNVSPNSQSSGMSSTAGFIIVMVAIIAGVLFYFKHHIIKYFNKEEDTSVSTEVHQLKKSIKKEKRKIKKREENKSTSNKPTISDLKDTVSNKIKYNKNQIADFDGYCYIGYDKGQRQCTDIAKNDVCLSGEIFDNADKCAFPRLR